MAGCPNCFHNRQPNDIKCPKCGITYEKYENYRTRKPISDNKDTSLIYALALKPFSFKLFFVLFNAFLLSLILSTFAYKSGYADILMALVVLAMLPAIIAKRKRRNAIVWWIFGIFLFYVALPLSIVIKVGPETVEVGGSFQ